MKRHAAISIAILALVVTGGAALAQNEVVKGQVKKIDESAGKITLTTGPIKSLDMDEDNMTMVYRVQDPSMLKQVKVGDTVRFEFQSSSAGITITRMQKGD
jgi:Cu(I)/Ag(I) efflux system periplasmic protein CusF